MSFTHHCEPIFAIYAKEKGFKSVFDPGVDHSPFPLLPCLFCVTVATVNVDILFRCVVVFYCTLCIKCNLITHKRDLASSLCSANSVIVMGHPKYESACKDMAVQHTKQSELVWAVMAQLGSACRCAALPADVLSAGDGCDSRLSLILLFQKDKLFRTGICTTQTNRYPIVQD